MRFPEWALKDKQAKVRYMVALAALEISKTARLSDLAKAADLPYDTLLWAANNNVSSSVAEKICAAVPGIGLKPYWLANPEWIKTDENGVIIE